MVFNFNIIFLQVPTLKCLSDAQNKIDQWVIFFIMLKQIYSTLLNDFIIKTSCILEENKVD